MWLYSHYLGADAVCVCVRACVYIIVQICRCAHGVQHVALLDCPAQSIAEMCQCLDPAGFWLCCQPCWLLFIQLHKDAADGPTPDRQQSTIYGSSSDRTRPSR